MGMESKERHSLAGDREEVDQARSSSLIEGSNVAGRSVSLRTSERRLLLVVVDFILLVLALVAALVIAIGLRTSFLGLLGAWKWLLTLAVTWFICASIFDIYNLARAASTTYGMRAAAAAAGANSMVYLMIPWLTPSLVNRSYGFLFAAISIGLIVGWRVIYAQLFTQIAFQRRSIIIGAPSEAAALAQALHTDYAQQDANPYRGTGHVLVGFIPESETRSSPDVVGLPILGEVNDLLQLIDDYNIDEVIVTFSCSGSLPSDLSKAILDCYELGIPVSNMSRIYERLTGRVPIEFVGCDIETISGDDDKPLRRFYAMLKRLMDIGIGLIGLLFLALLIPPIAAVNRMFSPGPLFYRQERLGKGAKLFYMIKFRSMIPDAEESRGAVWAEKDDDRVTIAGRWLRKLHLDELPQIINVLRGEMSMVGPRPERPQFVQVLVQEVPFYRARHFVSPGITGWAQIHQDYGSSVEDAKIKLEFDLYYIKKNSFSLDLVILLRTITKVLGFKGR